MGKTLFLAILASIPFAMGPVVAQTAENSAVAVNSSNDTQPNALSVAVGKSVLVSSQEPIERISVGLGDIAEASAASPHEVLVNGKAPGATSLIIWQRGGGKLFFDVNVRPNRFLSDARLETLRREIGKDLPGQAISVTASDDAVYLRGTAQDLTSAERAISIAAPIGKVVNLLYVAVPNADPQILLKVRFASLDRNKSMQLGFNLFSTGATNTIGSLATQQFPAPTLPTSPQAQNITNPFVFSDILNLFLFRRDLNLGATIKDLEVKGILQSLAEPNVLAQNGKQASFLAGGEFPYPVFQGTSGGSGAITIQFREFGIRLNFIPTITPRGSIKLQVAPEVSALDFTDGLTIQGFNVPALTTRKVKTEVELEEGQSFAIGGLLDKTMTENIEKLPFLGDIPILGKLFQSKNTNRQNTELIVIVTPELVNPIPAGNPIPNLKFPKEFLESEEGNPAQTSGPKAAGQALATPPQKTVPMETLVQSMKAEKPLNVSSTSSVYSAGGAQAADNASETPATSTSAPPAAVQH